MRTLVFYDEHFPYDGERPSAEALERLREWAVVAGSADVAERLTEGGWDALMHLHGPYFPKAAGGHRRPSESWRRSGSCRGRAFPQAGSRAERKLACRTRAAGLSSANGYP